jgi:site-specific DNA-methyltransferase (adenine-specific)
MNEHAGEPDKNGQLGVLATIRVLNKREVCTDSYITCGCFNTKVEAENLASYLKTRFARFLLLQAAASINLSKATYRFVPMQDFTESWTDEKLYEKYGIIESEQKFIESLIKPME